VAGFLAGGATAVYLLPVGMGLVLGFMGYEVAANVMPFEFVPLLAGIVCFAYGLFLTDLLLPVVASATGGLILYGAIVSLGMPASETVLVVATLATIGIIVQTVPFRSANGAIRRRAKLVKS
jgi:hypothetical protein